MPVEKIKEFTEELSSQMVQVKFQSVLEPDADVIWSTALSTQEMEKIDSGATPIPAEEICLAQKEDQYIGLMIKYIKSGTKTTGHHWKSLSM